MDETLKYFKLSGGDIEATVVVACKPDEVDALWRKFDGYELEETERPEGVVMVNADAPRVNPEPFVLRDYGQYLGMYDPFLNTKHAVYDGPNCARCQNRFKGSEWCSNHYRSTRSCYRFKLER